MRINATKHQGPALDASNPPFERREPTMSDSCKLRYYIAAHDEDALRAAIESDAEVIVMDLEQNCPPDKKEAGRALVQRACSEMDFKGSAKWIRVNIIGSGELEEDLRSLKHLPDGIVLAQTRNGQEVLTLAGVITVYVSNCPGSGSLNNHSNACNRVGIFINDGPANLGVGPKR